MPSIELLQTGHLERVIGSRLVQAFDSLIDEGVRIHEGKKDQQGVQGIMITKCTYDDDNQLCMNLVVNDHNELTRKSLDMHDISYRCENNNLITIHERT